MIRRLLRRWLDQPAAEDGLAETLAITIRCARRCAYDLSHAADMISPTSDFGAWSQRYADRANHWQALFSSGASMKDYRLKLHSDIEQRDMLIEKLRAELRALGHSGRHDREIPF